MDCIVPAIHRRPLDPTACCPLHLLMRTFMLTSSRSEGCFTNNVGLVVSQPPWGMLLRAILQGTANVAGSGGSFSLMRSTPKKGVFTYHFTNTDAPASWMNGFERHFELHIFQIAQTFRMLYRPEHGAASKMAVCRLLEQSAYLHHLTLMQAAACAYVDGSPASKPAPLCTMCSAVFPKAGFLDKTFNQKLTTKIHAYVANVSSAVAERLNIPKNAPSGSVVVGGAYTCAAEMPQCAHLQKGSCQDSAGGAGKCSFA